MKRGIAVLLAVVSIFVLTTVSAAGLEGTVAASTLYVRDQPNSESNAIHLVRMGEKVAIGQKVNEWYYITCANGVQGYVYAQFVSISETDLSSDSRASSAPTAVPENTKSPSAGASTQNGDGSKATTVATVSLPSITRIGDRGDAVTTIQQALASMGYNTGKIDGIFGQITLQAVRKFQKDSGLVVDGIVGKATVQALFGGVVITIPTNTGTSANVKTSIPSSIPSNPPSAQGSSAASSPPPSSATASTSASSSKTQALDWFSEGYNLINKNKSVTIYDLNTGVVWNAKYINGKNHADIIPASAADAKKITSSNIVGSYVRRPVIVTIAGGNYAGSMYAVGHGEENYCDYFKGVMCVHFSGSQTHGTQKVDADHQKAIEVALKATVNR